jgi:DNA-binding response OmpR family regulator
VQAFHFKGGQGAKTGTGGHLPGSKVKGKIAKVRQLPEGGANVYVEERTVDVHIRRLRKALQTSDTDYSNLIQTVRGTGYRFSARGVGL